VSIRRNDRGRHAPDAVRPEVSVAPVWIAASGSPRRDDHETSNHAGKLCFDLPESRADPGARNNLTPKRGLRRSTVFRPTLCFDPRHRHRYEVDRQRQLAITRFRKELVPNSFVLLITRALNSVMRLAFSKIRMDSPIWATSICVAVSLLACLSS
jgi:hypothetical protein